MSLPANKRIAIAPVVQFLSEFLSNCTLRCVCLWVANSRSKAKMISTTYNYNSTEYIASGLFFKSTSCFVRCVISRISNNLIIRVCVSRSIPTNPKDHTQFILGGE